MPSSSASLLACVCLAAPAVLASPPPALVRHAPAVAGRIEGSLQVLGAENVGLRGSAEIAGDLLVPGLPRVRQDRTAELGAVRDGTGAAVPTSHLVTLADRSALGRLVRRTDPQPLPDVPSPPAPAGTRTVTLRTPRQAAGDFATVRHLTLGEDLGLLPVPPGHYGDFAAADGSGFVLGRAGDRTPAVYSFHSLAFARRARLTLAGPVVVTLGSGLLLRGSAGFIAQPDWLDLRFVRGGLTVGEDATLAARATAPQGTVLLSEDARFVGWLAADRLAIEEDATLRIVDSAPDHDRPPSLRIETPAVRTVFPESAAIPVRIETEDSDGAIVSVALLVDAEPVGERSAPPWHFTLRNLDPGTHSLVARARTRRGATVESAAVPIVIAGNRAPTVQIVAPAAAAAFSAPANVPMRVQASDSDGVVAKVEFYVGALRVAEDAHAPFETNLGPLPAGQYILTARAVDNHGAVGLSAPVPILVRSANPAPVVTLIAPAPGAVFTAPASIVLAANAYDPGGAIARVEFFGNGARLGERPAPPYEWLLEGLAAGSYRFSARATDNAGAGTESAVVSVLVNQPPSVTLLAPVAGATVPAGAALRLEATAADRDGTVQRVDFLADGEVVGSVSAPPFRRDLATLAPGNHTLIARAYDNHGASATSSPAMVSVLAPNGPPTVRLLAPATGVRLTAPVTLSLQAEASDPDGDALRLEFLHGDLIVAQTPTAPYSATWTISEPGNYLVSARAIDAAGNVASSAAVEVVVVPAAPAFLAGFEVRDGYASGPLQGQQGWSAQGNARVVPEPSPEGERLLLLDATDGTAAARHDLVPFDDSRPSFLDLRAQPVPSAASRPVPFLEWDGITLGLVAVGNGTELQTIGLLRDGGTVWQSLPGTFAAENPGQPPAWRRLTLRRTEASGAWDLYVDGRLVAFDLPFAATAPASGPLVLSAAGGIARFDALAAGREHPLFADGDADGMDDIWELAHGLNPTVDDRYDDRDGDGVSNIREYRHGLRPDRRASFDDGIPDGVRIDTGLGLAGPVADSVPPSAPEHVGVYAAESGNLVTWSEATDNVAVSHYAVFRDGLLLADQVTIGLFQDPDASRAIEFGYRIQAVDFAGNRSVLGEPAKAPAPERDSDGRGLPDEWQQDHFGALGTDPSADPDRDGKTNLQEFRDGTDPNDFFNGVRPIHEPLYGGVPGPDDRLGMRVRKPNGDPWPDAPVTFTVTQGTRHLAPVRPAAEYRRTVTVRTDATGVAHVFLEPLAP